LFGKDREIISTTKISLNKGDEGKGASGGHTVRLSETHLRKRRSYCPTKNYL